MIKLTQSIYFNSYQLTINFFILQCRSILAYPILIPRKLRFESIHSKLLFKTLFKFLMTLNMFKREIFEHPIRFYKSVLALFKNQLWNSRLIHSIIGRIRYKTLGTINVHNNSELITSGSITRLNINFE